MNLCPFSEAWSSYAPFIERLGSLTFGLGTFLCGTTFNKCAMQLRRARFLSSERTRCHGAHFVSVALSIRSRAHEYSNQRLREGKSIGLSFHWRSGSVIRASKRRFCSLLLTSSQN